MSEATFFAALGLVASTVVLLALIRVAGRWLEIRHEKRAPVSTDAIQARLERIEMAVDATAVEVERIAEGNRFMAKLLAERAGVLAPARQPERVITPH